MIAISRPYYMGMAIITGVLVGLALAGAVPIVTGLLLLLVLPLSLALAAWVTRPPGAFGSPLVVVPLLAASASFALLVISGLLINLIATLDHRSWVISSGICSLAAQAYVLWRARAEPVLRVAPKRSTIVFIIAFGILAPTLLLGVALARSVASARNLEEKEAVIAVSLVPVPPASALLQISCFPCTEETVAIVISTSSGELRSLVVLRSGYPWSRQIALPDGSGVTVAVHDLYSHRTLSSATLRSMRLRPGTIPTRT